MITINVPVVYMAWDVMILMREIHFQGDWKGWALKIDTILDPEMATSVIWAQASFKYTSKVHTGRGSVSGVERMQVNKNIPN